jgi:AcrR family transcriptional regulator
LSAVSEPEPPTMRERYRAQVRQEIQQAALRQLAESGPGGLSISAIGKQPGVSGPALYRYFAGRDDLLTELVIDAYNDLADALTATPAFHDHFQFGEDRADSIWLAKIVERGMISASFVPPEPIRRLRTHTRYRRHLTQARTAEKQRVEKLLEDGHLKLSSMISNIHRVSGRDMLNAIAAGQRDPKALAQFARGTMPRQDPPTRGGTGMLVLHR